MLHVSSLETIESIQELIRNNAKAIDYEKNDISSSIQFDTLKTMSAGETYTITYSVTDAKGLSNSSQLTLTIEGAPASPSPEPTLTPSPTPDATTPPTQISPASLSVK